MSVDKSSNLNKEQGQLKSNTMDNKGFMKSSDNMKGQSSVYNPTTTNKPLKDKKSEISFHSNPKSKESDDSKKKFCTILCKYFMLQRLIKKIFSVLNTKKIMEFKRAKSVIVEKLADKWVK